MAETAAQKRAREAKEAAAAEAAAEQAPPEGDEQAASGDEAAPEAPEGDQGAAEAPEAVSDAQEPAQAAPEAEVPQRYLALRSMGGVQKGKEFEALPSDPRVKSGYAKPVGLPELPDAVVEALDGVDRSAG